MKDFCTEVRALRDIERFLANPTILLNVCVTALEEIMDIILEKLISKLHGCRISLRKAKKAFLTKDTSTYFNTSFCVSFLLLNFSSFFCSKVVVHFSLKWPLNAKSVIFVSGLVNSGFSIH